jgi:hypothetical protein
LGRRPAIQFALEDDERSIVQLGCTSEPDVIATIDPRGVMKRMMISRAREYSSPAEKWEGAPTPQRRMADRSALMDE